MTTRRLRFSFMVAEENARRVRADPSLIDFARRHLDARLPEHRAGDTLWRALLEKGPEAIAQALTEDTPEGDYVRETAPSFGALPASLRVELVKRARAGR